MAKVKNQERLEAEGKSFSLPLLPLAPHLLHSLSPSAFSAGRVVFYF
jgi:hypothetical protein